MTGDSDLAPHLRDLAVGGDENGRPFDSHIGAAVHALLDPEAAGRDQGFVLVGEEAYRQRVLRPEAVLGLLAVRRDADDRDAKRIELRLQRREVYRLSGAALA